MNKVMGLEAHLWIKRNVTGTLEIVHIFYIKVQSYCKKKKEEF